MQTPRHILLHIRILHYAMFQVVKCDNHWKKMQLIYIIEFFPYYGFVKFNGMNFARIHGFSAGWKYTFIMEN